MGLKEQKLLSFSLIPDRIACHADNGYGTPMQASRHLKIERSPKILKVMTNNPKDGYLVEGMDMNVTVRIDSYPVPTVAVGKNGETLQLDERTTLGVAQDRYVS